MPDLPDRFRALDQLEVPDIDARARALGPRPPTEPDGPSSCQARRRHRRRHPRRPRRGRVRGCRRSTAIERRSASQPVVPGAHELIAMSIGYGMTHQVGSTSRFTDIAVARPDGTGFRHVTRVSSGPRCRSVGREVRILERRLTRVLARRPLDRLRPPLRGGDRFPVHDRRRRLGVPCRRPRSSAEPSWRGRPTVRRSPSTRSATAASTSSNADGTNDRAVHPRTGGPNQNTPSLVARRSMDLYFAVAPGCTTCDPDGRGLRLVLGRSWSAAERRCVSPDGETLAVVRVDPRPGGRTRDRSGSSDADGSDLRRLRPKSGAGIGFSAVWSAGSVLVLLVAGPEDRSSG